MLKKSRKIDILTGVIAAAKAWEPKKHDGSNFYICNEISRQLNTQHKDRREMLGWFVEQAPTKKLHKEFFVHPHFIEEDKCTHMNAWWTGSDKNIRIKFCEMLISGLKDGSIK